MNALEAVEALPDCFYGLQCDTGERVYQDESGLIRVCHPYRDDVLLSAEQFVDEFHRREFLPAEPL